MNPTIVTALISGLCVAVPTIVSVIVTANARNAVFEERMRFLSEKIDALDVKVQMHNNFSERISLLEKDIKNLYHRLDDLRGVK